MDKKVCVRATTQNSRDEIVFVIEDDLLGYNNVFFCKNQTEKNRLP